MILSVFKYVFSPFVMIDDGDLGKKNVIEEISDEHKGDDHCGYGFVLYISKQISCQDFLKQCRYRPGDAFEYKIQTLFGCFVFESIFKDGIPAVQ